MLHATGFAARPHVVSPPQAHRPAAGGTSRKLEAMTSSASGWSAWIQWSASRILEIEKCSKCSWMPARWEERTYLWGGVV
eukprot:scaffold428_cov105-Isochrysis_galbana.AAC.5